MSNHQDEPSRPGGPGFAGGSWRAAVRAAVVVQAFALSAPALAASLPAAGDTYLYRIVNGYNQEVVGQIRYEVSTVDRGSVTLSVTPDSAYGGLPRTDVYTSEGNGLRHPVESHGQQVEYRFSPAYPAFVFPLDPGKSWSIRVKASVPATGDRRSVRVDGRVLGAERIRVPAGEFDTIKVQRYVYPGDHDYFLQETQVVETDWYAPALGRPVRSERMSEWIDLALCGHTCIPFRGDWFRYELVERRRAR
jgi:hypothetical protein